MFTFSNIIPGQRAFVASLLVSLSMLSPAVDLEFVSTKLPGNQFYAEREVVKGDYVELFESAATDSGLSLRFRVLPWTRAVKKTLGSDKTLLFPLTRLESREHQFQWLVKLREIDYCFKSFQDLDIEGFDGARQLPRVAVHRNSSHQVILENQRFTNLVLIENEREAIRLIDNLKTSAWFGSCDLSISDRVLWSTPPVYQESVWLAGGTGFRRTERIDAYIQVLRARMEQKAAD